MNSITAEANVINRVFARHRAGFRVDPSTRWRVTPAFTLFKIEKRAAERVHNLYALQPEIEHAIYEHRQSDAHAFVRVSVQPLALEVNAITPQKLHYGSINYDAQPHTGLCGMYYGLGADRPLFWNPSSPRQPHVLIAGTTGSGKTTLLQSLVLSMCNGTPADELRFRFVDFKNSPALRTLAKLPHVDGMVTDEEEALCMIRAFHAEIVRRRDGDGSGPRQILCIDELAEFTANADRTYRDQTTRLLHSIVRLGREFRMHLIACTQKPTAKVIGEQLKANLPVRLVGMVTSPEESKTATGIAGAGAHLLPGEGAFIHVNGGVIQRFQSPFVEDVLREVRAVRARMLLHHPAPVCTTLHQSAPVRTTSENAPVQTPQNAVFAPAPVRKTLFPLADKRALNGAEAAEVRRLAADGMSKNHLCVHVYGAKSTRYMAWITEALQSKPASPFSFRGMRPAERAM